MQTISKVCVGQHVHSRAGYKWKWMWQQAEALAEANNRLMWSAVSEVKFYKNNVQQQQHQQQIERAIGCERERDRNSLLFVCAVVEISLSLCLCKLATAFLLSHNGHLHFHCRPRMQRLSQLPPTPSIDCHNCAIRFLKLFTFISNLQLLPGLIPHTHFWLSRQPTHNASGGDVNQFLVYL